MPKIWREPTDHVNDCYFCLTPSIKKGFNNNKKFVIEYPNIPSAIRPVPHNDELLILEPREIDLLSSDDEESSEESSVSESCTSRNEEFGITTEPHLINESELNNLVRDSDFPKVKTELLDSRLKQWNLLLRGVKVCSFRTRQQFLAQFFSMIGGLVYCTDVGGIMQEFGYSHRPEEWRLFFDSSKLSLKAVLLHNENMLPSIPVGYAAHMKKTYENMKNLLQCINYEQYCWQLCGDFKVIAILLALQPGYIQYCCFLCEWDSCARHEHYLKKEWPKRSTLKASTKNVKYTPLVEASKILLPPLHIKLGLIKNFAKAMNEDGAAFKYICNKFFVLSQAKLIKGIFVGPQINKLLKDEDFDHTLTGIEKVAWNAFRDVAHNFFGNTKAPNYIELVELMIDSFKNMGCNISLKIHFLHSHLDFFLQTVVT